MTSMHSIQRHTLNTGVPQALSLEFCLQYYSTFTLFTFHSPPKDIQVIAYANDITITASHTKHCKAQELIQPYLLKIYEWAITNNFHVNTDKTATTLLH